MVIVGLLVSVPGCVGTLSAAALEEALPGSWECHSGNCPDPVIRFEVVDGRKVYNSWLHERPAAAGGEWSVDGNILTIRCCAGLVSTWTVKRVDDHTLVMEETGEAPATMVRVP